MKKHLGWLAAGLLGIALLLAGPARSGEEGAEEVDPQAEMRAMMAIERKMATPGPQHEALAFFVGTWNVSMRMVMPGAPPMDASEGVSEYTWLFEGRWLQQRYRGDMMGQPFESFGLTGYDNYKGKYVLTWIDNVSTRMVRGEGVVSDPSGNAIVFYGEMDEPMMGLHDKAYKIVQRKTGADAFVQEIWDLGIGPDGAKVVEMAFTRAE